MIRIPAITSEWEAVLAGLTGEARAEFIRRTAEQDASADFIRDTADARAIRNGWGERDRKPHGIAEGRLT